MTRNIFFRKCILAVLPLIVFFTACHSEKKQAKIETGGVIADETQEMSEKDFFFRKMLFPELRKQNYAVAQKMLEEEIRQYPEYKKEPLYFSAQSIIDFQNGKYEEARRNASRVIEIMEQRFAPKKPYQMNFPDEKSRNSVASHYLYRYQALLKLGRYESALADVETALKISEKPRVTLIKASLLILLKRYEDAVAAMNKAYQLDNSVLAKEVDRVGMDACTILYEQGYKKVKPCQPYFIRIDEKIREAERNEAEEN